MPTQFTIQFDDNKKYITLITKYQTDMHKVLPLFEILKNLALDNWENRDKCRQLLKWAVWRYECGTLIEKFAFGTLTKGKHSE